MIGVQDTEKRTLLFGSNSFYTKFGYSIGHISRLFSLLELL